MTSPRKIKVNVKAPKTIEETPKPAEETTEQEVLTKELISKEFQSRGYHTFDSRIHRFAKLPRRSAVLHWATFVLSMIALIPVILWLLAPHQAPPIFWVWLDIFLSLFFIIEFFTRSGFRWNPAAYTFTRFFDFIAMVPALVLAYYDVAYLSVWIWLILLSRAARAIDRALGDGFVRRNVFALAEGFEEEITDRVTLRILARTEADLERGKYGLEVADALSRNKEAILRRIRAEHPRQLGEGLAHIVGLDAALERAEERTFDSVIEIIKSPEVDHAIHDSFDSTFAGIKEEIGKKEWKKHLGIHVNQWR